MNPPSSPEFEKQLDLLLTCACRFAASAPSAADFTDWFKTSTPTLMPTLLELISPDTEEVDQFLRVAALNLYADLPLPDNNLQACGQSRQGRNDLCACGSGHKYKQCCGAVTLPPLFGQMNLLRYVLDTYPKSRLAEVCTSKANIDAVANTASQWFHAGETARVTSLLEPYFAGTGPLSAKVAPLFNILMDTWLELGRPTKRERLIQAILERGDRTLKGEALQRRTTMLADKGDHAGAWRAFKEAKDFNPNDPALSFLEVSTLLSEGRAVEAKSRAQWWAAFLAKQRDPHLAALVHKLSEMAKDPYAGMMGVATAANPDLQRLQALFQSAPSPTVRHQFEVYTQEDEKRGAHAVASEFEPDAQLSKLEKRWQKVFPQSKPAMTSVQNDAPEVWDNASDWLDLLQKYPDLWFSFEVMDDLVMAADTFEWAGIQQRLLTPMAERVAEQLRITIEFKGTGPVECPWGVLRNRPILRPIVHLAYICLEAGNWQRFMEIAHWMVFEINSNDNHGLRDELSCAYVRHGRWADAIALDQRYSNDVQPPLPLNAVLANYAVGDLDSAKTLLQAAKTNHPVAVKMLLEPSPKPVKPDSAYGIALGGKYEAWLYVGKMREFWIQHGAIDWARSELKPTNSKSSPIKHVQQRLL
jgi:tetratricopeptide (TPR) repeat protein